MSDPSERMQRRMAMLQRFAELALSSAEDLHARQLQAETPVEAAAVAEALHSMGRSLRQTLALEARLEREGQRQAADAAREHRDAADRAVERRKRQARAAVERLIYSERETEGREDELENVLDDALARAETDDDFLEVPLEALIERLCAETGVPYIPPDPDAEPAAAAAPEPEPPPRLIQMPDYGWAPPPDSS